MTMLFTKKIMNNFIVFLIFFIYNSNCHPIEVTGKNIKYYKLTPNEGSGSYNFDYGTHDGSKRSERGFIKHEPGHKEPLLVVTGSFKYPDANEVYYIADEQGYRIVSKEEVDELHSKLPNEILPTSTVSSLSSTIASKSSTVTLNPGEVPGSSFGRTKTISVARTPETQYNSKTTPRPVFQVPVTESMLIKLNVLQPVNVKPVSCPPGRCSGSRQSKIIQIKPIRFNG